MIDLFWVSETINWSIETSCKIWLLAGKGHAAPILYASWAEAGLFPVKDLLNLRKLNSDLEGHPTPRLNFIDVATGSLGQGLSVAAGIEPIETLNIDIVN